jgi:hypothetical protein
LTWVVQFSGALVALWVIGSIASIRHVRPFEATTDADAHHAVLLSILPALAFATIAYWKMPEVKPPKPRLPRKDWSSYANMAGFAVAVGAGWTTFVLCALLTSAIDATFGSPLPTWGVIGLQCLAIGGSVVVALWAFIASRSRQLEVFETAEPPELRLVVNLRRHADAFRERAKALEEAMEEAASISEQVQHGIELERQQLSEVHEQYLKQARLMELTHEQQLAVADLLSQQQARSSRRALLSNIMVGFVFYLAGVVTPALINTSALRDQLPQWLHFG